MYKFYFTGALLVWASLVAVAQQVTTLSMNSNIDDALIFDEAGFLYGAHYNGASVIKVSPDDWSSEEFSTGYNTPNGMALGNDGHLYLADQEGNRIYRIFADGSSEVFINNFYSPSGMILEPDSDTLVVSSYYGNRVVKIAPDGGIVTLTKDSLLNGPVGLCYDDDGQLYVGNFNNRRIIKLYDSGEQELLAQPSGSGWLGFIAYAKGYIYGTLFSQHKLYRTDLMGNDTTFLGGGVGTIDGGPGEAKFNGPNGIIASPSQDTLFISDHYSKALRMITNLEEITTHTKAPKAMVDWQIAPNPATERVTITLHLLQKSRIDLQVFDANGQVVQVIPSQEITASGQHDILLEIGSWPSGMYHVQLKLNDGTTVSQSFVKS